MQNGTPEPRTGLTSSLTAAFDLPAAMEDDVTAFHDVLFPLDLGYGAAGGFATDDPVLCIGGLMMGQTAK